MKTIDVRAPLARLCRNASERLRVLEILGLTGKRGQTSSLATVCRARKLEPKTVAQMLIAVERIFQKFMPVALELMSLTELCDQIESAQRLVLRREFYELIYEENRVLFPRALAISRA